MFHVKHYRVKHLCTLQNNRIKGSAKPKIDIELLVHVRVYQLQYSYYFGYNIMVTYMI